MMRVKEACRPTHLHHHKPRAAPEDAPDHAQGLQQDNSSSHQDPDPVVLGIPAWDGVAWKDMLGARWQDTGSCVGRRLWSRRPARLPQPAQTAMRWQRECCI
eukprot:77274-Chlamydomonas_euryale.AAC.2